MKTENKDMVAYMKDPDDRYQVWANTKDRKFYIQMSGEEMGTVGHNNAALAIVAADEKGKEDEPE